MVIEFIDKKWNLPKISQYEDYEYSPGLSCPICELKPAYNRKDEAKHDIVGCAEVNGEMQVLCECHLCGKKYRYHLAKKYNEDYTYDIEYWVHMVGLMLYNNHEIYKKFEID